MHLTLYKYLGEKNRLDKLSDLVFLSNVTGKFKADVSILSPVLLLNLPTINEQGLIDENNNEIGDVVLTNDEGRVYDFNYVYIEEFSRFYFVNNIVVSSNGLALVSCEVDALYSFKEQILNNNAMIERNEFEFNELINDDLLPLKYEPTITEFEPAAGALVNTDFISDFNIDNDYNIVLSIITDYPFTSDVVPPSDSGLPEIGAANFVTGSRHYVVNYSMMEELNKALLGAYSNFETWIKNVIALPFLVSKDEFSYGLIDFGPHDQGAGQARHIENIRGYSTNNASPYIVIADFYAPNIASYLDMRPFSYYELFIPFYGWLELDITKVAGARLLIYYSVDYDGGSSSVYLYDYTHKRVVFSSACQLAINMALTNTNNAQLTAQRNANNSNLALGLIASALTTAGGIASHSPITAAKGLLSGVESITSFVNTNAQLFDRANSSVGSPLAALYTQLHVSLRITKREIEIESLTDFAHQYGRPLMQVRQLRALSGFTRVGSVHLEGCSATDVEKEQIMASLLSGVIL